MEADPYLLKMKELKPKSKYSQIILRVARLSESSATKGIH